MYLTLFYIIMYHIIIIFLAFPELLLSVLESITLPSGAQIKLFCYLVVATWNSKSYIQKLDFKFIYCDRKKKNQIAEKGLSPMREHLSLIKISIVIKSLSLSA